MNAVPDTLIMKGELSLEKRCILNWDHGKKIEYLEEKGKKQSLKLYLVSHGDRYGGSQCTTGLICVPNKKSESSRKELSGFFVFTRM